MKNERDKNINRILVSLDFDSESSAFIESLVSLASRLDADLCGIFNEESQLQKIANLPFSREITLPSAHIRNLNSDQIAQHLQKQAENLRKSIKELSQISNVACSFRSTKGPRVESILRESYNFQLTVLLPEKYSSLKHRRTVKLDEIINSAVLVYDGSDQALKAVNIIKSLIDNNELQQLTVLTFDKAFELAAKKQFSSKNLKLDFQTIASYNIEDIISVINSREIGLLILPLEDELINQSKQVRKLLDTLGCPLLLVR